MPAPVQTAAATLRAPSGSRIAAALTAIVAPGVTTVSFDFFDTLVKRRVLRPADLFADIGTRLQAAGILPGYVSPSRFAQHRIQAEQAARQISAEFGTAEVALADIYAALAHLLPTQDAREAAAGVELDAERDCIFLNPVVAPLLAEAQNMGKTCVVCSDTYFSADDLRRFAALPGTVRIFASSEHRTGKGGGLFDVMLAALRCPAAEVVHIGDNYAADVTAAAARGIRAVHLPNGTAAAWDILDAEARLLTAPASSHGAAGAGMGALGHLGSLRNAALLGGQCGEELTHYTFGAVVFGPILFGYLRWLREQTRRHRSPSVVGLLREGATLAGLYEELVGELPVAQLGVSRLTLAKSMLVRFDRAAFDRVVPARQGMGLGAFARTYGLLAQDFPRDWRGRLVTAQDPGFCAAVHDHIAASAKLRTQVEDRAAQVKARLARHMHRVLGDYDRPGVSNIALADLGWAGTIQTRLRALFGLPQDKLLGLYLAVNDGALANARQGNNIAGYLFDGPGSSLLANPALRCVEILEQAFTPAIGSVVDYTAEGEAVHGPDMIGAAQRAQAAEVRSGVLDFCRLAFARDAEWERADGALLQAARAAASRFCLRPHQAERRLFLDWMHDDNTAAGAVEQVAPAVFDHVASYLTPGQLLRERFCNTYWPSAVSAPAAVRLRDQGLAALLSGGQPDLMEVQSGVAVRIRCGHGVPEADGFSEPLQAALNVSGRSAVTWTCLPSCGEELQIEFTAGTRTLAALDGMMVRQRVRQGHPADAILIEAAELAAVNAGASGADGQACLHLEPGVPRLLRLRNPAAAGGGAIEVTVLLRLWTGLPAPALGGHGPALDTIGRVDKLFGHDPSQLAGGACVSQDGELFVEGWFLDQLGWAGPASACLVLDGPGGRTEFPADLLARPDVCRHFGRILAGLPGVRCRVRLASMPLGRYRFGWIGWFGATQAEHMDPRTLWLEMADDGAVQVRLEPDAPSLLASLPIAAE